MSERPTPIPDDRSAGYWESAAIGTLTVVQCGACGASSFPPAWVCPVCRAAMPEITWQPVPGRGRIRSWTVVRQAFLPGVDVPYTLLDVELDETEGVRVIGRLVGDPEAELHLDEQVVVEFEDLGSDMAVPAFRRVGQP